MPIYEYKCTECGNVFEVLTTSSNDTAVHCSKCQSDKVAKILSAGSFRHGSGSTWPSAAPKGCSNKSGFS